MKTRYKILITIVLAILAVWLQGLMDKVPEHETEAIANLTNDGPTVPDLLGFYETYNEEFFQNKLPRNTVVDWSETDSHLMARVRETNGVFHIGLNLKFSSANRIARLMILHEMCHIKYFDDSHGPLWRGCMLTLEMEGANRAILIDGLEE
jgi:hypothetical protein